MKNRAEKEEQFESFLPPNPIAIDIPNIITKINLIDVSEVTCIASTVGERVGLDMASRSRVLVILRPGRYLSSTQHNGSR